MHTKIPALVTLAALLLAGCGDAEDKAAGPSTRGADSTDRVASEAPARRRGAASADAQAPCAILDDELLRAHFDIPDGTEITRSPSQYSPHPLCTVSWAKPDAAERQAQQQAAMMEYMQRKMQGEDVQMPSFRTANEVSLTLYAPPFDDAASALRSFDNAMKRLAQGITTEVNDEEYTFQADLEPVDGVGDKAAWVPRMSQLSVVSGNHIFHVGVNTGAEDDGDLETAKALAVAIAGEL